MAIVIGTLGYTLENMISTKHTPYAKSIAETRIDRLTSAEALSHATEVKKQDYENVLDKNLSYSLGGK